MDTSNFNNALELEKRGIPIADKFYREGMKALTIRRYDYNDPNQRIYQQHDIDCSIELDCVIDLIWLNVSEKFRTGDWGDMCIELWSDFERKVPGWATNKSGPDMYLYVTPSGFYQIWKNNHFVKMIDDIMSELTWDKINRMIKKYSNSNTAHIYTEVLGHDVELVKTTTVCDNRKYFGICVTIPWDTLYNDFFIDINKYDKNYNRVKLCN